MADLKPISIPLPASTPAPAPVTPAPATPTGREDDLSSLFQSGTSAPWVNDLDAAMTRLERRWTGAEQPVPVPWVDASRQLGGGLYAGLHMLVGGTGVGKTQWALQVALEAATASVPVAYVALELGRAEIAQRLIALKADLPWSRLEAHHAPALSQARDSLATMTPIDIIEAPPRQWCAVDLEQCAAALKERAGEGAGLMVIDFLQVAASGAQLRESIAEVAYAARQAARTHDLAVLVLSSVARHGYAITGGADLKAPAFDCCGEWPAPLDNPDCLIGLGKECGEIEYAADTLSVLINTGAKSGGERGVILATAKGRATGAGWSVLTFNGSRFVQATPAIAVMVLDSIQGNDKPATAKPDRQRTTKPNNSAKGLG